MTGNPLEADHGSSGLLVNFDSPSAALDGLPGFSPLANSVANVVRGDLGGAAIELAGAGLDALGYVSNPMKALAAGGLAWLIEHVSFLNRPLSLLAGDPGAVADQAQTWANIATHLDAKVIDLRNAYERLPVHADAKESYVIAAEVFATTVQQAAVHAGIAAQRSHLAGTLVATTRTLVRDWIAEWAVDRVWKFAATSSLTPATFGVAQAVFITDSVVSGARLANRATGQLRVLVRNLDELGAAAGKSGAELKQAARSLERIASGKGFTSSAAKRLADLPVATKAARVADEASLATRMEELATTARKNFDDTVKADPDLTAAAAARRQSDNIAGRRKSEGMKTGKDPVRESVKRQHSTAKANAHAKAAEAFPTVAKEARALADEVDALRRGVAGDNAVHLATHGVTKVVKEEAVQLANQDVRAEKAAEGRQDPVPTNWDKPMPQDPIDPSTAEPDTGPPTPGGAGTPPPDPDAGPPNAQEAPEQAPAPSEPTVTTTGPAPQPARQETWQVRGTLDP